MRLKFFSNIGLSSASDMLVLPFFKTKNKAKMAVSIAGFKKLIDPVLASGDFSATLGELHVIYESKGKWPRIVLLGLGKEESLSQESFRRAYGAVVKWSHKHKLITLSVVLPKSGIENASTSIAEGIFLSNYGFGHGKSFHEFKKLRELIMIGADEQEALAIKEAEKISTAVHLSRDLVNGNADDVTPNYLVNVAKQMAKRHKNVSLTVFDQKRIKKEKMELLLSVSRGSENEPALIMLKYQGNKHSKEMTALVGKGVTYDTGGLNLKPGNSMLTMRSDMGGAAAVLGALEAVALLGLRVNVTAVVPATENGIDAKSYKPGDVYRAYDGKTVEIGNTDAEGRLILADALAYVTHVLKPTRIIDFATLTGAMLVSLGSCASGLMSNNDQLASDLMQAGERTFERVWRFPLFDEYQKQLKSDIADLKNIGGRNAGSITAALFLQEFVGKTPWAHIDIAGTAFLDQEDGYLPKNATGVGVRLIVDFLKKGL